MEQPQALETPIGAQCEAPFAPCGPIPPILPERSIGVEAFLARLARLPSPPALSTRLSDRLATGRDLWPRETLKRLNGMPASLPEAIVWPSSEAQVVALVQEARAAHVCLVPFGGGSGVLGAALARAGSVTVDLKRMDRLKRLDPLSGLCEVEPGILGWHLEEQLRARGFTLGHFPSSLMTATVGGYVATRSAGQLSSRYGKIEDMVAGLRWVAGTGEWLETGSIDAPSAPGGLDQLLLGSEGTLGVLTSLTLRIHPAPAACRYGGVKFKRLEDGLAAMRAIVQAGLRPSVLRLYDELDTVLVGTRGPSEGEASPGKLAELKSDLSGLMHRGTRRLLDRFPEASRQAMKLALGRPELLEQAFSRALPTDCLLILGTEGDASEADAAFARALHLALEAGGTDLGPGPGLRWLQKRYDVSFKMPSFVHNGAFVDTLEVAATWEKIPHLYHAVRQAVREEVVIMAHFSHAWHEGISIYFSLCGAAPSLEEALGHYDRAWHSALEVVRASGGTVSHHHGVGLQKAPAVAEELKSFAPVFQALKDRLDPEGILNPGRIFPDAAWSPPRQA